MGYRAHTGWFTRVRRFRRVQPLAQRHQVRKALAQEAEEVVALLIGQRQAPCERSKTETGNAPEQRIVVVDWEIAGLGDLYYDLATVVYTPDSEGPIRSELEDGMLSCYSGEVTAWQRRWLLGVKMVLMLFTGAWGLAQHGMQQAGLVPAVEGFDYLEFAQYLFADDIPELQAQFNRVAKAHG